MGGSDARRSTKSALLVYAYLMHELHVHAQPVRPGQDDAANRTGRGPGVHVQVLFQARPVAKLLVAQVTPVGRILVFF